MIIIIIIINIKLLFIRLLSTITVFFFLNLNGRKVYFELNALVYMHIYMKK